MILKKQKKSAGKTSLKEFEEQLKVFIYFNDY